MEKLKNKKVLAIVLSVTGLLVVVGFLFFNKDDSVDSEQKPNGNTEIPVVSDNNDVVIPGNPGNSDGPESGSENINSSDPIDPIKPGNNGEVVKQGDDSTPEDISNFPKPGDNFEQKILLDFVITTTQQEKIIKNTEQGYTFTVSKNLQEEIIDRGENGKNLRFLDQEALKQEQIDPWEKAGCVLEVFVNKNPNNLTLSQWSEINIPGGVMSQKDIAINGVPAKLIKGDEHGLYNLVHILNPANSNVYEIVAYPHDLDTSSCISEFNKIIESYSFTNI